MNRKYFYYIICFITFVVSTLIIGLFLVNDPFVALFCGTFCIILGYFISSAIDGYISSRHPDFLYTTYEDLRKYASLRLTRREELQKTMLLKMQYMQDINDTCEELNKIFNANRSLKLTRWIVFRAWYKAQIDHMLKYPETYNLTLQGEPYSKDDDPLYDPNAPDWSLYDRKREYYDDYSDDDDDYGDDDDEYYDDDDPDEDDDDEFYDGIRRKRFRHAAEDGLAMGIGLGIGIDSANDLFSH